MLKVTVLALLLTELISPTWHYNLQEAKDLAKKEHRHILLNFSGSDWCGPCILLRKEVFDDPAFSAFADTALVLVNADFPRMKKNQLPKEQQQQNDQLADLYNSQGKFPLTVLLDADGKVKKEWEGNPGIKPAEFSMRIKAVIDDYNFTFSKPIFVKGKPSLFEWDVDDSSTNDKLVLQYEGKGKIKGVINVMMQSQGGQVYFRARLASNARTIEIPIANLGKGKYDVRLTVEGEIIWRQRFKKQTMGAELVCSLF